MMSKFTPSWALKGFDHHAPHVEPQPAAASGSSNVDGGGRGLPPSTYSTAHGQQQNGAGGQQRSKPSTAPKPPLMESHGVDTTFSNQKYGAREQQLLTNTSTEANPLSYGGDRSYPSATPGPYDNQQFTTKHNTESTARAERANSRGYHPHQQEEKRPEMEPEDHWSAEKDNKSEVKDRDTNQIIRPPSMSTQSQYGKVRSRSKTEERTFAPADPPASGPPQVSRTKSRVEVTPQGGLGGTIVAYIVVADKQVPWGVNLPYNQNTKETPSKEPGDHNKELQSHDARLQHEESKTTGEKAQGTGATAGTQRVASKPRDEMRQTNTQTNGTNSQQQVSGFDRQKESNDPYNDMGARQVGKPAPSTSVPASNEPSWVSMPSQKRHSRRLGVQESNEPYTYNNRQTSSKDRAAGATQMDQVAPGGTPLTAPSQEIQDRKLPTGPPPKTNIQQASQPVKEEKKGRCCSIL